MERARAPPEILSVANIRKQLERMINMKIYKKENDMIEVYEMSINDEAVKLYKDSLANRINFYDIKSSDNDKSSTACFFKPITK